jgi:predicted transcriptional regulator of viral defense system
MESYSLSLLTKKLLESGLTLISSKTLKDILSIKSERTYYRIVSDFIKNGVLINIEKNKYYLTGKNIDTFEIANFLYQPSYISLETALNYWGVLSQFPFEITNVTSKKNITKKFDEKIYSYSHINSKYFGMFTKKNNMLIALPEKALFDQIYLASKGLKSINFDEYDLENINIKTFLDICRQLKADKNIMELVKKIIK